MKAEIFSQYLDDSFTAPPGVILPNPCEVLLGQLSKPNVGINLNLIFRQIVDDLYLYLHGEEIVKPIYFGGDFGELLVEGIGDIVGRVCGDDEDGLPNLG